MKNKRLMIVLLVALVCGGTAAYLAVNYLGRSTTPLLASEPRGNQVAVAVRDLALGTVLRTEDVRLVDWPGEALPSGYSSSLAQVVGRGLITPVSTNEPLLDSKLARKEEGGGLAITIPEGMRAVSVKVDEVIGVAGFVLPGTRVDVLVTMTQPGGEREVSVTQVILQNIQTLAAGQTVQRDMEGKPQTVTVITLLVTPDEAERLTLASNEGRIQLALRNMLDVADVETRGARAASLVGSPAAAPVARAVQVRPRSNPARRAAAPRESNTTVVETYRGGERTLSTFSTGNP